MGYIYVECQSPSINHQQTLNSIGGLVVKLAVAKRKSASPGFDSRPMHHSFVFAVVGVVVVVLRLKNW